MHQVEILEIEQLTHNTKIYRLARPIGYDFAAGEATEAALDRDGWREQKRPFTFTGLTDARDLEFTIKSYFDHDGVTKNLWDLEVGDTLLIDDPWETLGYKGAGTFIAGGAGVTPFLALLRDLEKKGELDGHHLIVSDHGAADIILGDELGEMEGLDVLYTLTNETAPGYETGRIDTAFLQQHVADFDGLFYLCGPDPMTAAIREALIDLGADPDQVFIAS